MAGKKTSVWLGEDELAEWKASGVSLTDIVKRGLAAMREGAGTPQPDLASIVSRLDGLDGKLSDERLLRLIGRALERLAGDFQG
jgi:hypothetical protein